MKSLSGPSLKEAILRAAVPTFMDGGYDNTSMDEIAARAGTTKRTVYAHYGNKDQLFRAAIADAISFFHSGLPPLIDLEDPARELEVFAARFCDLSTWDRAVRLQRIAMAEAKRFPDLGRLLHRDVIERTEHKVADYLSRLITARHPGAVAPSPGWALTMASLFLNLTTGPQRFAALMGTYDLASGPPGLEISPAIDREATAQAVKVFLSGFEAELES